MGAPSNIITDPSSSDVKKQNVWIVRYGLTKFPLVEHFGPFNSPLDPTEGMDHAQAIASEIQKEVMESSCSDPVHVYSSPFTRTAQTAQVIASQLPIGTQVRIEEGLTEWQQKSLLVLPNGTVTYPKSKQELAEELPNVDLDYSSANPQTNCSPGNADEEFMEESEQELFQRCSKTLDGILLKSACHGESFVIVSHAPCDQSMAVYFEGKTLSDSSLSAWPLGGITKFSRAVYEDGSFGPWGMEFYGDTEHMPGMYKPGMKSWSLPTLAKQAALEIHMEGTEQLQVAQ